MMDRKPVTCDHCEGTKTCTKSGGGSCKACLKAAGRGTADWATVRCSYCGGTGTVWVEEDEEPEDETSPEQTQ